MPLTDERRFNLMRHSRENGNPNAIATPFRYQVELDTTATAFIQKRRLLRASQKRAEV